VQNIHQLISNLIGGDDFIAEAVVGEISQYGKVASEILAYLLKSINSDIRWWAIRALAEIKEPEARQLIIEHLSDEKLAVQQCAAIALRMNPSELAIEKLTSLLEHEDNMLTQLAGDALIEIGKKSTSTMIDIAQKGSPRAQIQAVRVMAKIGDTESISTLFNLLGSDSVMLDYWAEEGLNRMGIGMTFFDPS